MTATEPLIKELVEALEWALDIIDINDAFIKEQMGAECDQRIDAAAKAKARAVLAKCAA